MSSTQDKNQIKKKKKRNENETQVINAKNEASFFLTIRINAHTSLRWPNGNKENSFVNIF